MSQHGDVPAVAGDVDHVLLRLGRRNREPLPAGMTPRLASWPSVGAFGPGMPRDRRPESVLIRVRSVAFRAGGAQRYAD